MKHSGAPTVGDIVTVTHPVERTGLVVKARGIEIGIQYFKPAREAREVVAASIMFGGFIVSM